MWDFLSEIEGPLGALLLIGGIIFLGIKTSKKNIFGCDRFKLDVPNRCVMIHNEPIFFEKLRLCTVTSVLSHSPHLSVVLYKALKQLKPYVPVRAYIEDFKPPVYWEWIFIVVEILFFVFLMTLYRN